MGQEDIPLSIGVIITPVILGALILTGLLIAAVVTL